MKILNDAYKKDLTKIMDYYNSSLNGLDDDKIKKNELEFGKNIIKDKKRPSVLKIFISQYMNLLVIVLIFASILSLFTGGIENTIVIILVITLNAILGTFEYFKAEKSLLSLKKLTSLNVLVHRNNKKILINSNDLVCGDIVYFKRGDLVAADLRIIDCSNLEVDESMLTGESDNIIKHNKVINNEIALNERKNCLFRGTKINNGKGVGIVYSVGMNTEIGKIAMMMQDVKKSKSPLEKSIDKFSRDLAILIILVCIIVFIMSIYRNITIIESLMFSISLAVAAIPEALQTIVTIVLAISTEKMAKENAIVKDIKAIETLGSVDVICTDKTGTLTQNKMVVDNVYIYDNKTINNYKLFDLGLILCNDAEISSEMELSNNDIISTDEAIMNYNQKINNVNEIIKLYERIYEIPFSSDKKYQLTVNKINNKKILFIKGASDIILSKCKLENNERNKIEDIINENSINGYRILTIAYKDISYDNNINYNKIDNFNLY